MPSPFNPPQGCRFHTRCRYATEKCRVQVPELKDVGTGILWPVICMMNKSRNSDGRMMCRLNCYE